MNKDKKMMYVISLLTFAVLLVALFINVKSSRILAALLLIPLTVITLHFVRKRQSFSIEKKDVLILCSVVAVLYIVSKEMTGFYFQYYKNPYFVDFKIIIEDILPLAAIIVATELIRAVFLAQKNKFVSFVAFLSCTIAEILAFYNLVGITNFNRFMDLVGMTLFPAITSNIYYHYISKRYGALPNIIFRLITTLYIYFMPVLAKMPDSLNACIKLIFPILLLAIIMALFEKTKKRATRKGKKAGVVATSVTVIIVLSIAMLVSCQFRFGALVIATESMTGEINKGDVIIYERYDGQTIKEGQVVVFLENESKIVHRVVKIENIGGEIRYYTKGDANEDLDAGYRIGSDIFGLTDIKVAYLGYPTLWLRELLKR